MGRQPSWKLFGRENASTWQRNWSLKHPSFHCRLFSIKEVIGTSFTCSPWIHSSVLPVQAVFHISGCRYVPHFVGKCAGVSCAPSCPFVTSLFFLLYLSCPRFDKRTCGTFILVLLSWCNSFLSCGFSDLLFGLGLSGWNEYYLSCCFYWVSTKPRWLTEMDDSTLLTHSYKMTPAFLFHHNLKVLVYL